MYTFEAHTQPEEKDMGTWMDAGYTETERMECSVHKEWIACCWMFLNISFHFILSSENRESQSIAENRDLSLCRVCVTVTHKYQRSVRHNALLWVLHKDKRGLVEICVLFDTDICLWLSVMAQSLWTGERTHAEGIYCMESYRLQRSGQVSTTH